jgi:hypothetical protein
MMIIEGRAFDRDHLQKFSGERHPNRAKMRGQKPATSFPSTKRPEKPRIFARFFRHNETGGVDGREHATACRRN